MFDRLGRLLLRLRFLAVALWILAAAAALLLAPSLSKVGSADETSFLPADAGSLQARHVVQQAFPSDASASTATLVLERDGGLTAADRTYLADLAAWMRSPQAPAAVRDTVTGVVTVDANPELASMYRSPDGAVELATVRLNVISFQQASNDAVDAIRAHIAQTAPAGLAVHLTGQAGIGRDYMKALLDGTDRTTVVTIVLVVVILLLIYRAPLAALVPLLTIGAAYIVSRGVLGELGQAGWKLSSVMESFIVVLVFGVGTDYTIFLISRFREELGRADPEHAVPLTVGRIGAVITASAATVVVGLGSMAFGSFGMIQSTGPGLAIAIAITLLAGLTLTPALLAIFGHHLFWPLHEHRRATDEGRGLWNAIARRLTQRPAISAVLVLLVLLAPLAALPGLRSNFDVLAELPTSTDARQGFEALGRHLDKGQLLPVQVLAQQASTNLSTPTALGRLRLTTDRLAATPGVLHVRSVVEPTGDGTVPAGIQPSAQLADLATKLTPSGDVAAARRALLRPDATAGLDSAAAYLDALGGAFPDVAGTPAFSTARADLSGYADAIRQLQASARVNGQLHGLAAAVRASASGVTTNPSQAAAQLQAIGAYLQELAVAFPDALAQPSFEDARTTLLQLQARPSPTLVGRLAGDLDALGAVFDARPDALLLPTSLPATPASTALGQRIGQLAADVPSDLRTLSTTFAGRQDDYFLPTTMAGSSGTSAKQALDAYDSPGRDVSRLYVTVSDDPYSTAAFDTVQRIRDVLAADVPGYGSGARAFVGGPTAEFTDIQTTIAADFQRVAAITVLGILVVLALLLRSLVAPLYLVATVLLSYAATLGLSSLVFQRWLGQPGLNYFIPLMVFVLLVALGSDYNIFLMARVREESARHDLRTGIRRASARTGTVITSAGIILAGTFGALASAPLQMLVQVGVTVALGVLIDTFLVRSLLVPALTALIGEAVWWPFGRGERPAPAVPVGPVPAFAVAAAGAGPSAPVLPGGGVPELDASALRARLEGRPKPEEAATEEITAEHSAESPAAEPVPPKPPVAEPPESLPAESPVSAVPPPPVPAALPPAAAVPSATPSATFPPTARRPRSPASGSRPAPLFGEPSPLTRAVLTGVAVVSVAVGLGSLVRRARRGRRR
ncbi:MAG TPA: MMPL family transporter [Candidatus Limnocylindrales bacterium]